MVKLWEFLKKDIRKFISSETIEGSIDATEAGLFHSKKSQNVLESESTHPLCLSHIGETCVSIEDVKHYPVYCSIATAR
jgi:hypothetical protein